MNRKNPTYCKCGNPTNPKVGKRGSRGMCHNCYAMWRYYKRHEHYKRLQRDRYRKWKEAKPHIHHERGLRRRFGTEMLETYVLLEKKQKGKCAICGRGRPPGRHFAIDHCHKTGKVRGLLCDRCNRGLGYFGDELKCIERAVVYLKACA